MLDEKRPKQFTMNENYASSQLGLVIEVKSASKYVRLTGPSWHHWTFELICVLKSMMSVTASLEIDRMKFEENVKICFRAPPPVPTSFSVSSSHGAHCSLTWMQGVAFYSGHYPSFVNWWQVMLYPSMACLFAFLRKCLGVYKLQCSFFIASIQINFIFESFFASLVLFHYPHPVGRIILSATKITNKFLANSLCWYENVNVACRRTSFWQGSFKW